MTDRVANNFMLRAVQEWGQSDAERVASVQALLDECGFAAKATCYPVFGGIWPRKCEGKDGDAASAFLQSLTDAMPRGHYEDEVAHIEAAIRARKQAA